MLLVFPILTPSRGSVAFTSRDQTSYLFLFSLLPFSPPTLTSRLPPRQLLHVDTSQGLTTSRVPNWEKIKLLSIC